VKINLATIITSLKCDKTYHTVYEKKCSTTYEKECKEVGYGYHKDYKCKQVPREHCTDVPKKVPSKNCHQIAREHCKDIPKQIPKEECQQVALECLHILS